jgi:type I restriction enzyme S subunit
MSFLRYPEYKDSVVAWLGPVPLHWDLIRTRWLCQIQKRIVGELGYDVLSITQQGIKVKDIDSNDGQLSMDYSKYQLVEVGDFAMNHMDLLTGYVDIATSRGVTSPDYRVFTVRDRSRVLDKYLLYLFQSCYHNKVFFAFGQGSSQLGRWRLPTENFNDFVVPLPPRDEQIAVITLLDGELAKIDALIAEQEKLIALLKEKRQAVISHAVTKGLDSSVLMKDSGIEWLGEVPAHWQIKRVSWLFSIISSGTTPSSDTEKYYGGEISWVTTGELRESIILETERTVTDQAVAELSALRIYPVGTLLIALYGATIGRLAFLGVEAATNQACCAMAGPIGVLPRFVFYALMAAKEHLLLIASGGGQPNINQEKVRSLRVPVPDLAEQEKIVSELDDAVSRIYLLINQAEHGVRLLRERRSALISAAVTGKIDVRKLKPKEVA